MPDQCNKQIIDALEIARRLIILADEGETETSDDGCVLLYSVIRDSAYKIRTQAEREKTEHIKQGKWTT